VDFEHDDYEQVYGCINKSHCHKCHRRRCQQLLLRNPCKYLLLLVATNAAASPFLKINAHAQLIVMGAMRVGKLFIIFALLCKLMDAKDVRRELFTIIKTYYHMTPCLRNR
ncbi:MAG: hypothetical protein ACKPKO_50695, partial [Candidatus Fonsibacter sp.]